MKSQMTANMVLSLTDRASGPARAIDRTMDTLEKRQRILGRGSRLTLQDMTAMGQAQNLFLAGAAGAAGAVAPLAGALGSAQMVREAANFESALTNIQKKAGTSAEETRALGEEIKGLATSGELAVPIDEITAAYERGAAAGLPISDLKEFARLSVKAADAFEMPAEEVGDFAAKLKTGMGLSEEAVRRVFDLTNSLADAGISNEKDIVNFMDRSGASLKTLGMTAEQSLALGATWLNLGMSSEVAATGTDALASKLLTISRATGQKRKTFEKYMGSVEDFGKLVDEDANGALLTMLDRLKKLNSGDRMEFLTELVGAEHAPKMLRLVEATDELRRNLALANDESRWMNSLNAAYRLKLDDFWSQWQIVKNALAKLSIDAGTMGMPVLHAGLTGARTLIGEIDGGLKSFKASVDTSDLGKAMQTVGDLKTRISELLNMGAGGDSEIKRFFEDLARLVNEVADGIIFIDGKIDAVKESAAGRVLFGNDEEKAEGAQRLGTTIDPETGKLAKAPIKPGGLIPGFNEWLAERSGAGLYTGPNADIDRTSRARNSTGQVQERFGDPEPPVTPDRQRAFDAYRERRASMPTTTPTSDLGTATGRMPVPTPRIQFREAPPEPMPAPPERTPAPSNPRLSPRKPQPADLGKATGTIPIPQPRVEIEAAVRDEGERAARAAEAAGQRVSAAFNVTAQPTIDTRSIDAFIAKVEEAKRSLNSLGTATAGAISRARSNADRMARLADDYDHVNADIED